MRDWREMSSKAQSADTFREGSTGTCERTRLGFGSATRNFRTRARSDNAKRQLRVEREDEQILLKIK
jgi:hypothetical protein